MVYWRCWFRIQTEFVFGEIGPKFVPKMSKLSVLTENWHTCYLEVQIPNPDFNFWNSDPRIHFWVNLGWKSQSFPFFLKIGTYGILMMLILIPKLVFWISDPKYIFGKTWTKNVYVAQFGRKLAHGVSRRCWFLFQRYFFELPTLNPFFGKFGLKAVYFAWKLAHSHIHKQYLKDVDCYFDISFPKFQT